MSDLEGGHTHGHTLIKELQLSDYLLFYNYILHYFQGFSNHNPSRYLVSLQTSSYLIKLYLKPKEQQKHTVCVTYGHVEGVYLHVCGAVDWSVHIVGNDVKQRAVAIEIWPVHHQHSLTECTGTIVAKLEIDDIIL